MTVLRRKEVQKQRLGEYEEAVVSLKSKVRDAEGQAMRETVQDKVCPAPHTQPKQPWLGCTNALGTSASMA